MSKSLVPVVGCFVSLGAQPQRYRVQAHSEYRGDLRLEIFNGAETLHVEPASVRNGFVREDVVQDVPLSRVKTSLGEGKVLGTRTLGYAEQVLVEFFESGQRVWLPFESLRRIRGPEERLASGTFAAGLAERFRLKNLALALQHWNENTGALSHLEIDPLPHQLHLVHHILASGNLNWLIADDVGLGKTIEVGMILAALRQRRMDRLLIVCPAGLTRQWQEELATKFRMDDFVIYGRDVHVNDPSHWPLYPRVIASMDMLKHEAHLSKISESGDWDVIVFDEAHHLSRRQWGQKLDSTERYRLAERLRALTDHVLLLSATPHQGHQDRFVALLELLRPEYRDELNTLALNSDILRECVYRNRKADVTDAEGNFIFRGQRSHVVNVPVGELEIEFDRLLQDYVRRGYQAAENAGQQGVAIGFVMTTFRKLAASSHAAILASLQRRQSALLDRLIPESRVQEDERFSGEAEEAASAGRNPFFDGELAMLEGLISLAEQLRDADQKLATFLDSLLPEVLAANPSEKVLVFTEYRGTQSFLVDALTKRFGASSVDVIHGDLGVDEKRKAVANFTDTAQFLVSTEAGGEGLNLHERCHVLVNYDLPWNPMRLVQRVGRLYRYGQSEPVVVFNLHAPGTLDARVVRGMYERIERVVLDLAELSDEFHDGLHEEILGDIASLVDIRDMFSAGVESEERSAERIQLAVDRARDAYALQSKLLGAVRGFDPQELAGSLAIGPEHLRSFVLGMFGVLGCEIRGSVRDGLVVDVMLTEALAARLGRPRACRVSLVRRFQSDTVEMMDFTSQLFRHLIEAARRHDFEGSHASILMDEGRTLVTGILRWQDGQGRVMREEYVAALVEASGQATLNPPSVSAWMAEIQPDGAVCDDTREERVGLIKAGQAAMDGRLAERSNRHLHPSQMWLSGAASVRPATGSVSSCDPARQVVEPDGGRRHDED